MTRRSQFAQFSRPLAAILAVVAPLACSGASDSGGMGAGAAAGAPPSGATGGAGMAAGGASSAGAMAGADPVAGGGGGAPNGAAGAVAGGVGGVAGPASCTEASKAFSVDAAALDPSLSPSSKSSGNSAEFPVAIDPSTNQVFVGATSGDAALIASPGRAPISIASAVTAGIAVTKDGVAALLFDPNPVGQRQWAAVKRLRADGSEIFSVDMFRSPNLDDVGTKGAPETSRFGYVAETDELIAYFGHTQRYDDGVRHQGGFVGKVSAAGALEVLSGWWGSHNLDQRLSVENGTVALVGLGDAYPEGIFYGLAAPRMRTTVIHPLAASGNGATNGQLGGIVDLGDELIVPFVTNRSVPQDLDAGTWPDIDETIADRIREAAANGTDVGLLRLSKSGTIPMGGLAATWLDVQRSAQGRIQRLKSARYGSGGLIFLAWGEAMGSGGNPQLTYFTMVVDRMGAVCQPKAPLDARFAFTAGDDVVRGPDGKLVWANRQGTALQIVTLTPG